MRKLSTAPAEYDDTPSPLANVGGGAVGHTPAFRVEPTSARDEGKSAAIRVMGLEKSAVDWMHMLSMAPDMLGHAASWAGAHAAPALSWLGSHAGQAASGVGHAIGDTASYMAQHPVMTGIEGLGLHVGANTAMRAIRNSKAGHRLESNLMGAGIRHAMQGRQVRPVMRNLAGMAFGPELTAPYDMGLMMGKGMAGATPKNQQDMLTATRRLIGSDEALRNSPLSLLPHAVDHSRGEDGWKTKLLARLGLMQGVSEPMGNVQKAITGAAGVAALTNPVTATHVGLNAARLGLAASPIGERFAKKGLRDGLLGRMPSKGVEMATDFLLSPAALDPQRIGYAVNRAAVQRPMQTIGNTLRVGHAAAGLPLAQEALKEQVGGMGRGVVNGVRDAYDSVASKADDVYDRLAGRGDSVWDKVRGTVGGAYGGLRSLFGG